MVATTRTVESAITSTAPRTGPPALTGLIDGMVRAGGASTGGRWAGEDVGDPLAGDAADVADEADVDSPCQREGTTSTGRGRRGVRVGTCFGAAVGAGAGVGVGADAGGGAQQWSSPPGSSDHPLWQCSSGSPRQFEPSRGPTAPLCDVVSAAAAGTSNGPRRMRKSDAPASNIKSARLVSKSPPRRCYGRARWDL
jgi:hypothetical protein